MDNIDGEDTSCGGSKSDFTEGKGESGEELLSELHISKKSLEVGFDKREMYDRTILSRDATRSSSLGDPRTLLWDRSSQICT